MAVLIRSLEDGDTARVVDLYKRCAAADDTLFEIGPESWERFVRQDVNKGGSGFRLAVVDDVVVGLATSSRREPGHEVVRHFRIIVEPKHRRSGVGTALLESLDGLETDAILQSLVPEKWTAGQRFLERFEFSIVETELEMKCTKAAVAPSDGDIVIGPHADVAGAAAAVAALHNEAYKDDVSFVPFTEKSMADLLADAELWTAKDGDDVVGYCHLEDTKSSTWIESIVVSPKMQGRGVGTRLGAAVVADILDRREKIAMLSVSDRNPGAQHLYEKLGFEKIDASLRYRRAP